jgi:hypothetical protein
MTSSAVASSVSGKVRPSDFRGLLIEHKFDLHLPLGRLGALQDFPIDAFMAIGVHEAATIAHQAADLGDFAPFVDCRDRVARRQRDQLRRRIRRSPARITTSRPPRPIGSRRLGPRRWAETISLAQAR